MKRTVTRTASAVLLALSLCLSVAACNDNQSGDSNTDNQTDEVPGSGASRAPS
jgi:hypothetical protein